jgi:hypothetical protein
MIIVPVAKAVVGAAAALLAVSSGRNMLQSVVISHCAPIDLQMPTTVTQLAVLNRRQILEIYKQCEVPNDISDLQGEWNGMLLKNNAILVRIM